jgi:hypothetical protein
MKKLIALAVLLFGFTITSHAQTTFNVTAPSTPCSGTVWPINCNFTVNGQSVHIYFYSGSGMVLLPPIAEGGGVVTTVNPTITGYSMTIPPGAYFPSVLTVTFQGGDVWDGEEYVPVTGTATLNLTYTAHPVNYRRVAWTASATLSMTYSY